MKHKILIIEDEYSILDTLKINLELENYQVETANNGKDGLLKANSFYPNLILLDIMLPEINGIDVYKKLRQEQLDVAVIFLTAKNNSVDKINGLKLGADDYITKPFDLEELLLRIQIALKRTPVVIPQLNEFRFGTCEINFLTYQVKTQLNTIETLSKREISFLKLLIEKQNNVVSRDDILEQLWTKDENPSSRTIDNYILNFRKLFEVNPKEPIHFLSIRSVGYKFVSHRPSTW